MNPLWVLAGVPLLLVGGIIAAAALIGSEKRRIGRVGRTLAVQRAGDTSDSFATDMERSGVPRDISLALYAEMSRALEVHGIYSFPSRADDGLNAVYGIGLPDDRNDFMDTDLREIASGIARRSGRNMTAGGEELDARLAKLSTVRDLGRWITSLSTP